MKAFGFRAEKDTIHWAVVSVRDNGELFVADKGKWKAPKTYKEDQALTWFRENVLRLVDAHKPARAGVRYPETFGRTSGNRASTNMRLRVEGVLVEALHSQAIPVSTGAIQQITSRLGSESPKSFKAYLENEDFRGLDLSDCSENCREAIIVAASCMENSSAN